MGFSLCWFLFLQSMDSRASGLQELLHIKSIVRAHQFSSSEACEFFPDQGSWHSGASLVAQMVKNLPTMLNTQVRPLDREDPLEKGMATHSNILAWRIPCTEEPDRLQSMGSQRDMTEQLTLSFKRVGEGDRGRDGWMASLFQWTLTWSNCRRWWGTGRPGMLQSMRSQTVRHDLATEQQQSGQSPMLACNLRLSVYTNKGQNLKIVISLNIAQKGLIGCLWFLLWVGDTWFASWNLRLAI